MRAGITSVTKAWQAPVLVGVIYHRTTLLLTIC